VSGIEVPLDGQEEREADKAGLGGITGSGNEQPSPAMALGDTVKRNTHTGKGGGKRD
jgi:hypothetical protein